MWVVGEAGELDEVEVEEVERVGEGGCVVSMSGSGSESLLVCVGAGGPRLAGVVERECERELRKDRAGKHKAEDTTP